MKPSKRFDLNALDYKKILQNALVFLAPALFVLLADVTRFLPEWFNGGYLIIAMWLVNTITDALRKFIAGRK